MSQIGARSAYLALRDFDPANVSCGSNQGVVPGRGPSGRTESIRKRTDGLMLAFSETEETSMDTIASKSGQVPWNKGKLIGSKPPLRTKDV